MKNQSVVNLANMEAGLGQSQKFAYQAGKKSLDFEVARSAILDAHQSVVSQIGSCIESEIKPRIIEHQAKLVESKSEFAVFISEKAPSYSVKSIEEARSVLSLKFADVFVWAMMLGEALFGYWIFKEKVLPDDTWQNYLTSAVVGGMVCFIGLVLKKIPALFPDFIKQIYCIVTLIFSAVFVSSLVIARDSTMNTSEIANAVQTGSDNFELMFNVGLLGTLLFGGALISILTRDPNKEKHSKEIINAFGPVAEHTAMLAKFQRLNERLVSKLNHLSRVSQESLERDAVRFYLQGTKSFPSTYNKRLAAEKIQKKSQSTFRQQKIGAAV